MQIARLAPAVLTAAALLVSASACGGADAPDVDSAPQEAPAQSPDPAPTAEETSAADGQDSSLAESGPGSLGAAEAAVSTAESAVDGAQAYSIELEDDETWSVDVLAGTSSTEVDVSADGSEVLRSEADDDHEDEERRELDAASVTIVEALEAALGAVEGTIDSADLDEENGTVVWEIEIRTGEGKEVDVVVDAASGEIVRTDG